MHRHACACTQVLAYTPAVLARTHTRAHTHTHTHARMHTHTKTHARAHTHEHARTRTCTCTHARVHARKQARTYVHTCMHALAGARLHTRTHLHARTAQSWSNTLARGTCCSTGLPVSTCVCTEPQVSRYIWDLIPPELDRTDFPSYFFAREHCARYPACLPNPMPDFLRQGGVLADIAAEI